MAIAAAPPINTRIAALNLLPPPTTAPTAPVMQRVTSAAIIMTIDSLPVGASTLAKIGNEAPSANAIAELIAACNGLDSS